MWILISFIIFNILMKILNRPKTTSSGRIIYFCQSFISPQTYPWPLLRPCIWEQEDIFVDRSFVQGGIHRIPCGHEVTIIINFDKRLDLWPLGDFLLAHGSCHFCRDGDQFQPPEHGCRVILRCHHQYSSRWLLCVQSSNRPGPAPPSRVSWTCPFRQLPLGTTAESKKGHFC